MVNDSWVINLYFNRMMLRLIKIIIHKNGAMKIFGIFGPNPDGHSIRGISILLITLFGMNCSQMKWDKIKYEKTLINQIRMGVKKIRGHTSSAPQY